ncbi:hypothetical protein GGX14DRAFT_562273 [Mycena pura]|uniref:Uncharacterized protein n=1 Tax=Mycena pura TaxID=153505 RepID=A0AAD6VP94_9AGAR|nr:hypothetical protein GGX14DRAFT_562273 [Mycena pura]
MHVAVLTCLATHSFIETSHTAIMIEVFCTYVPAPSVICLLALTKFHKGF